MVRDAHTGGSAGQSRFHCSAAAARPPVPGRGPGRREGEGARLGHLWLLRVTGWAGPGAGRGARARPRPRERGRERVTVAKEGERGVGTPWVQIAQARAPDPRAWEELGEGAGPDARPVMPEVLVDRPVLRHVLGGGAGVGLCE